jgi:hypothetical protein
MSSTSEQTPCSPIRCDANNKTTGQRCKNQATYLFSGQRLCGVHMAKDKKDQAEILEKVKTRSTVSAAVTLLNVCDEIDEAISRRLRANDLSDESTPPTDLSKIQTSVTRLNTMKQDHRRIIIRRAIELNGSPNNIIGVISHIPTAVSDFLQAFGERQLPMSYKPLYISTLKDSESNVVSLTGEAFIEDGSAIHFSDIDITVVNCSKHYLRTFAYNSADELINDENLIYMGPKGLFVTPLGTSIPEEDSEWFIPLPSTHKLRIRHNQEMVEKILARIENNEENPEKYLALKGKTLGCICLPYPCHCMVYIDVIRALTEPKKDPRPRQPIPEKTSEIPSNSIPKPETLTTPETSKAVVDTQVVAAETSISGLVVDTQKIATEKDVSNAVVDTHIQVDPVEKNLHSVETKKDIDKIENIRRISGYFIFLMSEVAINLGCPTKPTNHMERIVWIVYKITYTGNISIRRAGAIFLSLKHEFKDAEILRWFSKQISRLNKDHSIEVGIELYFIDVYDRMVKALINLNTHVSDPIIEKYIGMLVEDLRDTTRNVIKDASSLDFHTEESRAEIFSMIRKSIAHIPDIETIAVANRYLQEYKKDSAPIIIGCRSFADIDAIRDQYIAYFTRKDPFSVDVHDAYAELTESDFDLLNSGKRFRDEEDLAIFLCAFNRSLMDYINLVSTPTGSFL